MRTLLGQILGAWLGFATVAVFMHFSMPKSTAITCGWCGHPVPMDVAKRGGIGAVNAEMRDHMEHCANRPMHVLRGELADARAALKSIHQSADEARFLCADHPLEIQQKLAAISDLAGRLH